MKLTMGTRMTMEGSDEAPCAQDLCMMTFGSFAVVTHVHIGVERHQLAQHAARQAPTVSDKMEQLKLACRQSRFVNPTNYRWLAHHIRGASHLPAAAATSRD